MKSVRTIFWTIVFGLIAFSLFAQNPKMVKDIVSGVVISQPWQLVQFGDCFYFGTDNASGIQKELWKSDGTNAGTTMVKQVTLLYRDI